MKEINLDPKYILNQCEQIEGHFYRYILIAVFLLYAIEHSKTLYA
jgi:hypothetical protein